MANLARLGKMDNAQPPSGSAVRDRLGGVFSSPPTFQPSRQSILRSTNQKLMRMQAASTAESNRRREVRGPKRTWRKAEAA